ncbi:MAG: hypothetical protein IJJ26_08135 [Victivallales bacterium]|nr:hypothetical protein [Victivallales bacterium]
MEQELEHVLKCFQENGKLTNDLRTLLESKLNGMGVPRFMQSQQLCVSELTLNKWLKGPTVRCSVSARRRVAAFLRGDLDSTFLQLRNSQNIKGSGVDGSVSEMVSCMELIQRLYQFFSRQPRIAKEFLTQVVRLANQIFLDLVTNGALGVNKP